MFHFLISLDFFPFFFFLLMWHFGVWRVSPPGHAVVLRFGWCGVAGGVMDSAVLVVERCADSEVGGREGGPLAGLFPGWSIFVELYICFGNILWSR